MQSARRLKRTSCGLGLRVEGLGFWVLGLGFRALGFRLGYGFRGLRFRGLGFRVMRLGRSDAAAVA